MTEIKHPSYEYTYYIKAVIFNEKAKAKQWKVCLVREEGFNDKGIVSKKTQRSFLTKEEAMEEVAKYKAKIFNINTGNTFTTVEDLETEQEKKEKQYLSFIFCPNMLGFSNVDLTEVGIDKKMAKTLRKLKDSKGFISIEDAKKSVEEYKANNKASTKKWWKLW